MRLYIFGNGNLSFADFVQRYQSPLASIREQVARFIVCDSRGADTLPMEYLKTETGTSCSMRDSARSGPGGGAQHRVRDPSGGVAWMSGGRSPMRPPSAA